MKITSSLNNNDLFSTSIPCTLSSSIATTVSITSLTSTGSSLSSQTSSITTTSQFTSLTPVPSLTTVTSQPSSWEYNFDMDLPELTELLPPSKIVLENEMDSLTALMVGGS